MENITITIEELADKLNKVESILFTGLAMKHKRNKQYAIEHTCRILYSDEYVDYMLSKSKQNR